MKALIELETFFKWLLETTWQAAVLAVIILLVQRLMRHRLSPAWRYGLWFLLVARLLMPMTPRSAVSVFNLAKLPPPPASRAAPPLPTALELPTVAVLSPRPALERDQAAAPPVPALVQRAAAPVLPPARVETAACFSWGVCFG